MFTRSGAGDLQTFLLRLPETRAREVQSALQAIGGVLGQGLVSSHVVLETWSTARGLVHRLRVPSAQADQVVRQLRVHVPGIRVSPEAKPPAHDWTLGAEFGLTNPSHRLRIPEPETLSASLLAALAGLGQGEALLYQLVLGATSPEKPPPAHQPYRQRHVGRSLILLPEPEPGDLADIRAKLGEVVYLGVIRVSASAATTGRAKQLLRRAAAALLSANSPYTRTQRRWFIFQSRLLKHIARGSAPAIFPATFTLTEITGLSAWPIGSPHVAGLPQRRTRHLPATDAIARSGLVLLQSNFPGDERPLAISFRQACSHIHLIGPTNCGKTVCAASIARQFAEAGYGLTAIETKGGDEDLFHRILDVLPRHRLGDVIIVDVADSAWPVPFNLLADGNPRVVVEELCQLFAYLYRDTRGVWTREVLYFGLMTLVSQPGYTFVDLANLLMPRSPEAHAWRDELIRSLTDPELRAFWQRFLQEPSHQQNRIVQPVLDRIWQLNARPELRRIIGQSQSSFSMREVLEQQKILLINLAGVGEETAGLAGTLFVNALWKAVKSARHSQPSPLFLDEFQNLLNLPIDPESTLAQARAFNLPMVLAHQHLNQLPIELRSAVMSNTRAAKIVFETSHEDAHAFAREFGRGVSEEDFINQGRFEVIARIATNEGMSGPVTGVTLPPAKSTGLAERARQLSRRRYGRPAAEVDAEIASRCSRPAQPPKEPKLGPQKWK